MFHFLSLTTMAMGMGLVQLSAGMDGTKLKLVPGIGVGMKMRVVGTVRDGYKYASPCSSLVGGPKVGGWPPEETPSWVGGPL